MKKKTPKVPRERRKGTFLATPSRLEEKVKQHALKTKKKKPKTETK